MITALELVPNSLGSVGVQVTFPDCATALTAPVEQLDESLSCTWLALTCWPPTAPLMILRVPTELNLSFQLPTLPFWSCA